MTIDQVLQHALDHHPLLRVRRHEVDVARAQLIAAGLLPNPQLVIDTNTPVAERAATDTVTRLMFTIPTGGKRGLARSVASAGVSRARFTLSQEMESVLVEAADAALEVQYLQERAALEEDLSEMAAEAAQLVKSRFDLGQTTFPESIVAAVHATAIQLQHLDTQTQLQTARLRLSRAIGLDEPQLLRVESKLEVADSSLPDLATVLALAERRRPELAGARMALTESKRQLALAYAQAKPDPILGPRIRTAFGEPTDAAGARISLDLPVFDRNQGGICASAARVGVNRAQIDVVRLNTLSDVASAYLTLSSIQTHLEYYQRTAIPLVEQTEAALRDAFSRKVVPPDQISDLLQQFAGIRLNHLQLRYQHNRLRTQLELLLGCRLSDLEAAESPHPDPEPARAESIPAP